MSKNQGLPLILAGGLALTSLPALAQEPGMHRDHDRAGDAPAEQTQGGERHEAPAQGVPEQNHRPGAPAQDHRAMGPAQDHRPGAERPRQFDRQAYRRAFVAPRKFRVGAYHAPPGWTYRRWTYGQVLPRAWWGPEYFLTDYVDFGLAPPPYGYEWVRNGDDALLIDTNTGEILQVEYDVFE